MQINFISNIQDKVYCALLEYKGEDAFSTGNKSFKINDEKSVSSVADFKCLNTVVKKDQKGFLVQNFSGNELIVHHNLYLDSIYEGTIEDLKFGINDKDGKLLLDGNLNFGHSMLFNSSLDEGTVKNFMINKLCNLCLQECAKDFFHIDIPNAVSLPKEFYLEFYPPTKKRFNNENNIELKINKVVPVLNIVHVKEEYIDTDSNQEHLCFYKEKLDNNFIDVAKLITYSAPSKTAHELFPISDLMSSDDGYFIYNSNDPFFSQHSKKLDAQLLQNLKELINRQEEINPEYLDEIQLSKKRNSLFCIIIKSGRKVTSYDLNFWKFVNEESIDNAIDDNNCFTDENGNKLKRLKRIDVNFSFDSRLADYLTTPHEIKSFIMDNAFANKYSITEVKVLADPGFDDDYRFYKKVKIEIKSANELDINNKMDIQASLSQRLLLTGLKLKFDFIYQRS